LPRTCLSWIQEKWEMWQRKRKICRDLGKFWSQASKWQWSCRTLEFQSLERWKGPWVGISVIFCVEWVSTKDFSYELWFKNPDHWLHFQKLQQIWPQLFRYFCQIFFEGVSAIKGECNLVIVWQSDCLFYISDNKFRHIDIEFCALLKKSCDF